MAEEIKDLIAKIQQEGVQAAEIKAAEIKAKAENDSLQMISAAQAQAEKIIEQADNQAKKTKEATQAALKQAGRDMLISLKQEIIAMLDRLIKVSLRQALTTEELSGIIVSLIKNAPLSLDSQIIVSLSKQDKDRLEQGFLNQLIGQTKKEIVLKSVDEISSGFTISFDAGRSIFDFSGQALSDYISSCLKPELTKILDNR
jgi:V/A-type H+-transporting ATPase subunit E